MTDPLQQFPKTEVNSTQPDFNKGANLAYWGNMPALYSENATSWPEWMHYIEGWAQDVFTQLVTGLSDTQDNLNGTVSNLNTILNNWQKIIDGIPDKIRQDVLEIAEPEIQKNIDNYVRETLPNYIDELFKQNLSGYDTLQEYVNALFNQEIVNYFNNVTQIPETFATLADLKKAYPTGKNGIFVTADTGHKYIYSNNSWTDAGIYQAAGIADDSVTLDKIDKTSVNDIVNSLAIPKKAVKWNVGVVTINNDDIILSHDPNFTDKDFGVSVPMKLDSVPTNSDIFYLNFDYISSSVANNNDLDKMEIWLLDSNLTLKAKISNTFFYASSTKTGYQLTINGSTLVNNGVLDKFYIMLAVHNVLSVTTLTNYRFNQDNGPKKLDLNKNKNKVVVSKTVKSKAFQQNYDLKIVKETIFVKSDDPTLSPVIEIPYFGLDISKDIYFGMKVVSDQNTTSRPHFWLSKLSSTTPNANFEKGFDNVRLFIDSNTAIKKGVLSDGVITVTTGSNSKDGLTISDVTISNEPIDGDYHDMIVKINENTIDRHNTIIGEKVVNIDNANKKSITGLDFSTPIQTYNGDNGILNKIHAYVDIAGNYAFKIAKIDQNNLIVDTSNDFSLSLVAGYNDIDMSSFNYSVPNGAQLFMNLSSASVYSVDANHLKTVRSLVRDQSHPTTNPGYSGQMMYEENVILPFNYEVIDAEQSRSINELKTDVAKNKQEITQLNIAKNNIVIKSPNGFGFRLVVDNSGNLSTTSLVPNKAAVFGNSLTNYAAIGGFGLAASNQNSDWFGVVKSYVTATNPAFTMYRGTIGGWEGSTTATDHQNYFDNSIKPNLSTDTDLVIVQAGDNVNTIEKATDIYQNAKQLLLNIKAASPNARIFWIASWFVSKFPNIDLIQSIKQATQETGTTFVDITSYAAIPGNNSYIGAKITKPDGTVITVTDSGYAAHPGDNGHRAIANLVNSYLGF